jgi:hypothetical protein
MKYAPLLQLDDEYNDSSQQLIRWSWLWVVVIMPILALIPVPQRDPSDLTRTSAPFVERHELKVIDAPSLPDSEQTQRTYAATGASDNETDFSVLSDADFV